VEGFTITNGYTWANGGGVYVNAGTLRNCLVTGNTAGTNYGGGVYATSASSLITNCEVVGNLVEFYGGGVFLDSSAQLWNSRINYNSATRQTADPRGGGVYINSSSMFNCIIISNTLPYINCTYGGGICAFASTVRNCLVMGNWSFGAGGVRLYNSSTIDSCTIVSNTGYYSGLVVSQPANFVRNTISCWNSKNDVVDTGANNYFTNCSFNIFWDLETRVYPPWRGSGNIDTNNPGFVSPAGQNYRLAKGSPCINKGLNQDWMTTASDLDGRSRVDRFSRQVDVGAYEFLPSGTMFTVY